jgi:hypothetical protein
LQQLTTEQAIGQLLQILRDLEPRVKYLEQALIRINAALPVSPPAASPAPAKIDALRDVPRARKRRTKRRTS